VCRESIAGGARADLGDDGVMTTNPERKKRSVEPAVTVARLVRSQLRAMGCARFDLGVRRDGGEMVLREGQDAFAVSEAVKWLRHENAKGAHVYIRPAGVHSLSLLDDLTAEAIERMKAEGFEPAAVVETSPHNFQVWLNHGEILLAARSTAAAKELAERFGGDPSSADWRHFGRLAGFTNPKPERRLASGLRPFTRLRSAKGHVYSSAAEFLTGIGKNDESATVLGGEPHQRQRPRTEGEGVKPLAEFHADPMYAGDLHRADLAWAKHAAGCGLTLEQIKGKLLIGRDLSKKGNRKRQLEYAERTARKALEQMGR